MGLLTARTVLVLAAVVLVAAGVVAPGLVPTMPPWSRAVLIAAGLASAVLDRCVVHATASDTAVTTGHGSGSAAPVRPTVGQSGAPIASGEQAAPGVEPGGSASLGQPDPGPFGPPASAPSAQSGPEPVPAIELGVADDASAGTVVTRGEHLVVVGHGPLAEAVFAAILGQVAATAAEVRRAPAGGSPLPDDTEVAVCWTAGGCRRTVVRVPDHSTVPRLHDAVIEVGRYGCGIRVVRADGRSTDVTRVLPVLPLLPFSATEEDDAAQRTQADDVARRPDADDAAEVATSVLRSGSTSPRGPGRGTRPAAGVSADRPPPGPDRPGRRHRAPARRSPP